MLAFLGTPDMITILVFFRCLCRLFILET